ncbi:lasso peptide biosynthesis B2 protein [Spirosoma sp.]|uniref:lasso peptide biosynthesis B2 protein n=1 Tax=Spirosoma sp. TaxID=1899569 RepID=UPI002623CF63|nr:lasso peptide biosynthesis B2 protein [Spirosoma sp.]MCX6217890.1 lasso peptide biosynthesis B2 protein [Spirosoma sp.]
MRSLSKLRSRLAKLRRVSWSERWLLMQVFAVLITYKGLLVILPFRTFLSHHPPADTGDALSETELRRVIWAIQALSTRLPLGFTCLVQALSAKWLLKKHPAIRIYIGVHKTERQAFAAHAWIVYKDKTILGEQANQVFKPILHWN